MALGVTASPPSRPPFVSEVGREIPDAARVPSGRPGQPVRSVPGGPLSLRGNRPVVSGATRAQPRVRMAAGGRAQALSRGVALRVRPSQECLTGSPLAARQAFAPDAVYHAEVQSDGRGPLLRP